MSQDKTKSNSMDVSIKPEESSGALRRRYIEPPFSIIDGRTGEWKKRKNKWIKLGIDSEVGRSDIEMTEKEERAMGIMVAKNKNLVKRNTGGVTFTSVFDPALTELIYKWWGKENGTILDPFAGGSVRGIVASKMGFKYKGIELRKEQVEANIKQGEKICKENIPEWICGDSNKELDKIDDEFDFIFSCPPYVDLEIYSNSENDLSNMPYEDFLLAYRSIINKAVQKLKPGHLAVFVVGDVRDKDGYYYDFVSDTKKAFIDSGAKLYNEAILLDPIGTAMLRANNNMKSLKLVKIHQNILCFKKLGNDKVLKKKIVLDYINKCPDCSGKIKRTKDGRMCQDCFKEF